MRYLITGGAGVVGSLLAARLLNAGHDVTILDACEAVRNTFNLELLDRAMVHAVRLEKCGTFLQVLVRDSDRIVHAAASTGIPHSADDPDDDWDSNVEGTRALLEAVRKHPRPTVVMSSVKPYGLGRGLARHGVDESYPLEPDEPYAASKAAQSMLAMGWARSYDLPIVCLRFSNLYGPAACHGPRHGWLTWFCIQAALGWPSEIQGSGDQARDMLFSDDIDAALLVALDRIDELRGRVFNVGGGPENVISVFEAWRRLQTLRERLGLLTIEARKGPTRRHEDEVFYTDYRRFQQATGWSPQINVEHGIEYVFAWAGARQERLAAVYKDIPR